LDRCLETVEDVASSCLSARDGIDLSRRRPGVDSGLAGGRRTRGL